MTFATSWPMGILLEIIYRPKPTCKARVIYAGSIIIAAASLVKQYARQEVATFRKTVQISDTKKI